MRAVAVALLPSLLPALAVAQMLDATDPQAIAAAVQEAGFRAVLTTDGLGDPMIESAAHGHNFVVQFFGCDSGIACKYLVFRTAFAGGSTLEAMNAWNADQLVGTAFLDAEGDPALDFFVSLDGGVSRANLLDVIDWWQIAMGDFVTHIGR
jgi:hypothetical protein